MDTITRLKLRLGERSYNDDKKACVICSKEDDSLRALLEMHHMGVERTLEISSVSKETTKMFTDF